MKCVCGYQVYGELKAFQPPFIHLGRVTGIDEKESKYFEKYACPKCGTVKVEI